MLRKWCAGAPLELLQQLRVLRRVRSEQRLLLLCRNFQATLKTCLEGLAEGSKEGLAAPEAAPEASLMQHAVSSWDKFLEGLTEGRVSESVAQLELSRAGALTAKGFQFILDERQQQLWKLLLAFLEKEKASKLSCLKIIFELCELRLGQLLSFSEEKKFLKLLEELGVLCRRPQGLVATPAALALHRKDFSARLSRVTGREEEGLGIVVESNFKVYCYCEESSKQLQKSRVQRRLRVKRTLHLLMGSNENDIRYIASLCFAMLLA